MTRRAHLILVLLVLAQCAGLAQDVPTIPADSTAADSVIARMMSGIGDALPGKPNTVLADSQWHWTDAVTLPDVMAEIPGVFQPNLGEEGKPVPLWYLGGSTERISSDGLFVGSPLEEGGIGSLYPPEFIESVEELRGADAILTGSRWNLRTYQYASPEPKTAIRFVQRPFETIFTDGWYAQNIARSTNLLFGFQRRTSDGRFTNAALNSWNLRGRVRYNVTPWLNLMGSWSYEKTSNGMNGGVDRGRSALIFDDVSAAVVEPRAYELRTRRGLSLHALADLFGDSLSLTRLTLASVDEEREFNRPVASFTQPAVRQFAITDGRSIAVHQSVSLGVLVLRGMAEYRSESAVDSSLLRGLTRTSTAVGVSAEARFTDLLVPTVAFRSDDTPEGRRTSVGASVRLSLPGGFFVDGSYERRSLFPSFREAAWRDSLLFLPAPVVGSEQFTSLRLTWEFLRSSHLTVEGFRREQRDARLYRRDTTAFGTVALRGIDESIDAEGLRLSGLVTLGSVTAGGWMTLMDMTTGPGIPTFLPPAYARWEVTWKDRVFKDELGLRVSVRGSYYDRHDGFSFDPRTGLFVLQSDYRVGRMTRLDGFLVLEIGDALVSLSWENILNTDYFTVVTYPMFERRFSLGVRWKFLD